MSLNDRSFAYAQLGYLLIVALTLILLPGASFFPTLIAMAGVWIVTALCYQATAARNSAGWWTLLIAATALAVGVIANIHFFTAAQGAETTAPVLQNIDARANFDSAQSSLGLGDAAHSPRSLGYPLFISAIWHITGITIVAPLIINMLMILLTAITCGTITVRLLSAENNRHSRQWLQSCAIIMTVAVCYLMTTATILVKDAGICLSMAMTGLGLTIQTVPPATAKSSWRLWSAFAIGIIGVATFRPHYLFIVIPAIIITTPWRHCSGVTFRRFLIMSGATIIVWTANNWLLIEVWDKYSLGIAYMPEVLAESFTDTGHPQHAYHSMLFKDYYQMPLWHRLLWLPANAALIYLIPFPWDFSRYIDFGYTYIYAKIAYPWYAIGGMILFYFLFLWRRSSKPLKLLTIAAAILWLIPAYITAGSVSRYVLPLVVWLIPAAVTVSDRYVTSRRFRIFAICYCVLLTAVLTICYHMQHLAIR